MIKQKWLLPITAILVVGSIASCDTLPSETSPSNPAANEPPSAGYLDAVFGVQDSLAAVLLSHDEVVGLATSLGEHGNPGLVVLVKTSVETWGAGKLNLIPERTQGFPVRTIVVGEIYGPRSAAEGVGVDGAAKFSRPVPIGVSTGPPDGPTGTIGARVMDGVAHYSLSNNHVYAGSNQRDVGDPVLQPGSADGGEASTDFLGSITRFEPIDFGGACTNLIDAAIALTGIDLLDNKTPAGGYGVPKSESTSATVGLEVQKYGRTTGLTFGEVIAIHATVQVNYGPAGTACFVDQIVVTPGSFSAGGDSGSLVVAHSSDNALNSRPVGLLFAGSESISVANDIDNVLSLLSVTLDGLPDAPSSGGGQVSICHVPKGNSANQRTIRVGESAVAAHLNHGDRYGECAPPEDDDSDEWDAEAQLTGEVMLRVVDATDEYVEGIEICAYYSATSSVCGYSADEDVDGSHNWSAEMQDGQEPGTIPLDNDTQYVLKTSGSINAIYIYRELGDVDVRGTFVVSNASLEQGYFTILDRSAQFDAAVVEAVVSNVSVGTPRIGGTPMTITWDAAWSGSGYTFPTFVPTGAKIILQTGASTILSASESHATGSFDWTPNQVYTNVKIRVEDNQSSGSAESAAFDVDSPISFTIDGPSSRGEGQQGTWTAEPSGGTQPWSYDWDYLLECNEQSISILVEECGSWNQGGTSWSWSHSVSGAEFDLRIRLKVTDSNSPAHSKTVEKVVAITDV